MFGCERKNIYFLPAIFPLLTIVGMRVMNSTGNNIILMVLLSLITAYMIFIVIMNNKVPNRVYAPIVFLISISLILAFALVSNHIYGSDSNYEYYFFQLTMQSGHWQVF